MEDQIYELLVEKKDIDWKAIIYDLVKAEGMDPWNVNVSLLTQKYISRLKQYTSLDLQISGKVVLAAAILLKIKSQRLVGEDLNEFDRLLASSEQSDSADAFYDGIEQEFLGQKPDEEKYELLPRTPQPRKRKVSVFDLVKALEKALEVKHRRLMRLGVQEKELIIPPRTMDIGLAIKQIFKLIRDCAFEKKRKKLKFSELCPSKEKLDKIFTFIPLLHLDHQRKIDLEQEELFSDFDISLKTTEW